MSDPELERIYRGIADRSKPRTQEPPLARPNRLKYLEANCPNHPQRDWKCPHCKAAYHRERRRILNPRR